VRHVLPGSDSAEQLVLLGVQVLRDETKDGLADDLLDRVAEDALGSGIPTSDSAIEVLADYGIVGGFHDRSQPEQLEVVRVRLTPGKCSS
jgi:hypothetical protein